MVVPGLNKLWQAHHKKWGRNTFGTARVCFFICMMNSGDSVEIPSSLKHFKKNIKAAVMTGFRHFAEQNKLASVEAEGGNASEGEESGE